MAPRTRARSARSTGNPLLASREAVRFRSASASRSGGAVHSCIGNISPTLNQADGEGSRGTRPLISGRARGPGRATTLPVRGGSLRGGNSGGLRRLPSPCGCGACRARCRCGPVRAASSSPTCCRSKAWSYTPGPRNCDRTGTACWPSEATGPTGPGNAPPPSRSRPFVALTEGRLELRPCRVIRTMRGAGSFLLGRPGPRPLRGPHAAESRRQDASSCRGTRVSASR